MERKFGISGSTLKMIAIISMLIDHAGATIAARMLVAANQGRIIVADYSALYQTYSTMRDIGRIAFPIFCFLLVQGFEYTRDRKKYAMRLGVFCLISEIPFDLAFNAELLEFEYQNVFFTLFIGLLTMMVYRKVEEKVEWSIQMRTIMYVVIVFVGMSAAEILRTDYAAIGVLCIMVLYICRSGKLLQAVAGGVSFLWEIPAPLAFIPIWFYNGKRGWKMKYFFYLFYPIHLLILYGICCYIGLGDLSIV